MLSAFSILCTDLVLWPWPQECHLSESKTEFALPAKADFKLTHSSALLKDAFARMKDQIYVHEGPVESKHKILASFTVKVADTTTELGMGTDESYGLTIEDAAVEISAKTLFGALHGMKTFSQLVIFSHLSNVQDKESSQDEDSGYDALQYTVPSIHISDYPRFAHRGLLVDTSRHYLSVPTLLDIIDEISTVKANVLHWHITDDPSFPIWSGQDDLWQGAFSEGEVYTKGDVQRVVAHARKRGVRVVPEIDVPGHTKSWSVAHPEIFPAEGCPKKNALAPEKETYDFLQSLLTKLYAEDVFVDAQLHLGGDEVPFACWNATATKRKTTPNKLFHDWLSAVREISINLNKTVTWWDEAALQSDPPPSTENSIIQIWRTSDYMNTVIDMGYDVILSPSGGKDDWYLDHLDKDFQSCYDFNFDAIKNLTKVLGGEGCMWGESVDQSNGIPRIFPRFAAIAERLWTTSPQKDKAALHHRIGQFRCTMLIRGSNYGTLNSKGDTAGGPHSPSACSTFTKSKVRRRYTQKELVV